MNSNLLAKLPFDPAYLLIGMAVVIIILLILLINNTRSIARMKSKYAIFMRGENAMSLESTLIKRLEQLKDLQVSNDENRNKIAKLFEMQKQDVQKVGIVKYDAFNEMGGKLSFSLAILNQQDTGVVLNVVHTRDGCYSYIKEIITGDSVLVLTDEEKQAIHNAMHGEKFDFS